MQRTRVLHILDKLSVAGSQIHGPARQLAYHIPNYPADYEALVCGLRRDPNARLFLTEQGVETVCLGRSKFDVRALGDIQRLVATWNPSILHLHGYAAWTFGRIIGRRIGAPVVLQEHFIDAHVPAIQRISDWWLRKQQHIAIAVSEAVRQFMVDDRYIRDTPVEVIWNAIPVEDIRNESSNADTGQLRASLDIPANASIVGIVSRLAEGKGHDCFLEAAARIRQEKADAHFVIVGAGPLREALERQAETLGLSDSVRFVGHQANVVPFLSMFDISVLPSISEGFPLAVLETLAARTPAVLTDLPAYHGVYDHGKDVLMVPIDDPAATAAASLRLLNDPALAKRLVENAQRVLSECSLQAVISKYLSRYERLMRQHKR